MATKAAVQTVKCTPQDRNLTKLPAQGRSAPRGKRKLEFDLQRFKGKTFFLDLNGYRRAGELELELAQRGATIEKFFHHEVKYLVTNRLRDDQKRKSQSSSTLSPNTPGTAKSNPSQLVSPLADSPETRVKQPPPYQTRAQKLLQMSLQKQKKTAKTDIVTMAKDWGCKVVYLDELLTEISKLKPLPQKDDQMVTLAGKQVKVRCLKAPCFKIEDLSRGYRPLVYETNEWPRPDPASKACPFDSPKHGKAPQHAMRPPQHKPSHSIPAPLPADKKPGYCECCAVRYEDLQMHLGSAKHMDYASNSANFTTLDGLIAKGTSFSDFITGIRSRHLKTTKRGSPSKPAAERSLPVRSSPRKRKKASHQKDVVVLVTPPSYETTSPSSMTTPKNHKSPRTSPKTPKKSSLGKSPQSGVSRDKIISIPENVAFSPHKLGELCLVRVVDTPQCNNAEIQHEYMPGFVTPHDAAVGTRSGMVREQRLRGSSETKGETLKRPLDEESPSLTPSAKRVKRVHEGPEKSLSSPEDHVTNRLRKTRKSAARQLIQETPEKACSKGNTSSPLLGIEKVADRVRKVLPAEVIPETPQKILANVGVDPISPGLCNLDELLDSISCKVVLERTPESGPKRTHDSVTRKSPRLLQREQVNISSNTEDPQHMMPETRTPLTAVLGPITPDISLQGVVPLNKDTESPATLQLSSSVSEEGFNGFSPDAVRNALPDFISAVMKRSPRLMLQKLDTPL